MPEIVDARSLSVQRVAGIRGEPGECRYPDAFVERAHLDRVAVLAREQVFVAAPPLEWQLGDEARVEV
jgi:hypothetical protein